MNKDYPSFDVIIIGGSYAGMSAAMALGRSLRKVLIIDSGKPCNRQTPHSHNFITLDGETPASIAAKAKEQVLRYSTVSFLEGTVISASKKENGFEVVTDNDASLNARRLLLATGISDLFPNIPGLTECWGISVLHCPYCHGYEVAGKRLGVLAKGEAAYDMTKLIHHWSKDLTLFTNGPHGLTREQLTKLQSHQIEIIEKEIKLISHHHGQLSHLILGDNSEFVLDALFAKIPFKQQSDIAQQLGCSLNEMGFLTVNEFQQTSVTGVYAAGDNSTMRALSIAVGSGTKAGAVINKDLIDEEF